MKNILSSNRRHCDVLLIHPPWFRLQDSTLISYPVGPCYVAGALEAVGLDVLVWNGDFDPEKNFSVGGTNILKTDELTLAHESYLARLNNLDDPIWSEVMEIITITKPKVVGLSAYSTSFKSAMNVAKLSKRNYPNIPIVIGGVHPSIAPEECLRACEDIDIVVIGESELTAPPLFTAIVNRGYTSLDLSCFKGIAFKGNGNIVRTEQEKPIMELDKLALPARHLLIDADKMPPHAHQALYGFRGCPFHCIFCGSFNVFGRVPRMRSAESMYNEIEQVNKRYGTRYFYICDDIFILEKKRAMKFCSLLKQHRLPIFYSIQSRGEMLSQDLLKELKDTGCQHIAVGVEVGDEEIRRKIKKGNTIEDMRKAAKLIRKAGLRMVGFFMFGFPWETKEEMLKTLRLMEELDPCVAFPYLVTPSAGTELLAIAQEMGLVGANLDLSSFHHESPNMGLSVNIPENERKVIIDSILQAFARHNRRSLRRDLWSRPFFYLALIKDLGILSSWKSFFKYFKMIIK